jgi:hypothetical protein
MVPACKYSLGPEQRIKFMALPSVEISGRSSPQLAVVLAHAQTRESLKTGRLEVTGILTAAGSARVLLSDLR